MVLKLPFQDSCQVFFSPYFTSTINEQQQFSDLETQSGSIAIDFGYDIISWSLRQTSSEYSPSRYLREELDCVYYITCVVTILA